MATLKRKFTGKKSIVSSPNVVTLSLSIRRVAPTLNISTRPEDNFEVYPIQNWSVVVTNPAIVRKYPVKFKPIDKDLLPKVDLMTG